MWRHMLDLGPATSLLERALERWGCADAEELLFAFTRIGGLPASERGRFADAVLDEAEAGDPVAREIVVTVGGRVGDYARVCAARTGQLGAPFPLVLCGGVIRHHPSQLLRDVDLRSCARRAAGLPGRRPGCGRGADRGRSGRCPA